MLANLRRRFAITLRRRPLLPFLLTATLAVDVVLFSLEWFKEEIVGITAAFAQLGLLGLWAGQLRSGWKARCLTALAVIIGVSWIFAAADGGSRMFTIYLLYAGLVATTTAASRYAGRLRAQQKQGADKALTRFSIAGILTATTVVAVLASLARYLRLPPQLLAVVLIVTPMVLLPIVAHDLVRRIRVTWIAICAVLGVSIACGLALVFIVCLLDRRFDWEWILLVFGQGGFYLLWLLGLRVRLHRVAPEMRMRPALKVVAPKAEETESAAVPPPLKSIDVEA